MGRCNNRRVQQAALASRNTPSRARFSKPPPSKKKAGRGGKGRGRGAGRGGGRNNNNNASSGRESSGRHAAVIGKISQRVQEKSSQQQPVRRSTAAGPLSGVDIMKLDEITLSDASIQVVTKLLTDLNVMESTETSVEEKMDDSGVDVDEDDSIFDDQQRFARMDDDPSEDNDAIFDEQQRYAATSGGYAEYEDDAEEAYVDDEPIIGPTEEDEEDSSVSDSENDDDQVRESPLFVHLTTQLSFSEVHVERACRAIENWQVPVNATTSKEVTTGSSSDALDNDQLALAMDWLCLHLTDDELKAGFRRNPKSMDCKPDTKHGNILAGTGRTKPIPHSSISVAPPITSDHEWRETLKRQSRKVGFFRLGFHHAEAEKACDETMHVSEKLSAEEDEDGLRIMLSLLEKETLGDSLVIEEPSNKTDFDFAESEREQEVQALEAIFDDQFKVQPRADLPGMDRYLLTVTPVEELQRPGHTDECRLHVFCRPGYPVLSPPLLLFTNSTLPPTLLRRINVSLIQHAHESTGEPIIFAAMDFLANHVHEMQIDFIKEQRAKEMETEQLRMRREAGHDVDAIIEAQYENDGKLGRRQKAKLRAAEQSFNHSEALQQKEQERLQRQEERLERIRSEESSLRTKRAERAVEERAKARIDEEAELASRAAMNAAFNRGESADQARAAARKARKESLRVNGRDVSSSEEEDDSEAPAATTSASNEDDPSGGLIAYITEKDKMEDGPKFLDEKQSASASNSTPATMAFMERLRKCYNDAVREKVRNEKAEESVTSRNGRNEENEAEKMLQTGTYHLTNPCDTDEQTEIYTAEAARSKIEHIPTPVPVPTGDLAGVMKDVIQVQNEQPWLISSEARAPRVSIEEVELTQGQRQQRDEISKKLQDELIGKHKAADLYAKKNVSDAKTNGKSGKSQQFHKMRSQREGFVLLTGFVRLTALL